MRLNGVRLVVGLVGLLLAGCLGGGDPARESAGSSSGEEQKVAQVLEEYQAAIQSQDPAGYCAVIWPDVVRTKLGGLKNCEKTIFRDAVIFGGEESPVPEDYELEVVEVTLTPVPADGTEADRAAAARFTGKLREGPTVVEFTGNANLLETEGRWYIVSFGDT